MKPVTVYEAADGSRWENPIDAAKREQLIADVAGAMRLLAPKPDTCEFSNGSGYLQHSAETVHQTKALLISVSRGLLGSSMKDMEQVKPSIDWLDVHPGWFCRMCDGSHRPLEDAWSRLCCIDDHNREWGQPYYASHPHEAKQVCLNA